MRIAYALNVEDLPKHFAIHRRPRLNQSPSRSQAILLKYASWTAYDITYFFAVVQAQRDTLFCVTRGTVCIVVYDGESP